MRWLWRLLALLLLPTLLVAAVAGVVVLLAWRARSQLQHARVEVDLRVLVWARVWTLVYGVGWTPYLGILGNEGASVAVLGKYPLGDKESVYGPAVGPGQVLSARVRRLWAKGRRRTFNHGDWDPLTKDTYTPFNMLTKLLVERHDAGELADASNTRAAVWASVLIYCEALDEMHGDWKLAVKRYNGFGAPAQAYADRAEATIQKLV